MGLVSFLPAFLLTQEIVSELSWAVVIGALIGTILSAPLGVLWYRLRGTTRPIFLLPATVEVTLFATLLLGLQLWLEPALWKTLALALLFVVVETVHRLTMPRHWAGPGTEADAVPSGSPLRGGDGNPQLARASAQKRNDLA